MHGGVPGAAGPAQGWGHWDFGTKSRNTWNLWDREKGSDHCEVSESDKEWDKVRLGAHQNALSMMRPEQKLVWSNGVTL